MKTKTKDTLRAVFIYSLSDPMTCEVRYIGKTISPRDRMYNHLAERRLTHKANWIQSLLAEGLKPCMRVLEEFPIGVSDSVWQKAERRWIKRMRKAGFRLTNLDSGGHGGSRHSGETKAKMSAARKGKKKSAETRARMSAAWSGVKRSPEFCAAVSRGSKGKKRSAESIAKTVAFHSGRKRSPEARARLSAGQLKRWAKLRA